MNDSTIELVGVDGEPMGILASSARELVLDGEKRAKSAGISKPQSIENVLRQEIGRLGVTVSPIELHRAMQELDRFRSGAPVGRAIQVRVSLPKIDGEKLRMRSASPGVDGGQIIDPSEFFEGKRTYPNAAAAAMYGRLVGIEGKKDALLTELRILFAPSILEAWSQSQFGVVLELVKAQGQRVPLIILAGDVGCGKTALAETVGEALVKCGPFPRVHVLKLNTQVRGRGHVGEMSDLIVRAFAHVRAEARKHQNEPTIMVIDEADSLASSRDSDQMHHEDKAGLNTLLQQLDGLRMSEVRIAVIFITNRPIALDPAIRRRAALEISFDRPNTEQREELFRRIIPELRLSKSEMRELAEMTGARVEGGPGFTASDICDKLLPRALRIAFSRDTKLTLDMLKESAMSMAPSLRLEQ